jgi:hypothetical protein
MDNNHPHNLVECLKLLHEEDKQRNFSFHRNSNFSQFDRREAVFFLFNLSKKDIDISIDKHFEAGYRVFAFRAKPGTKVDYFNFSLSILGLWPKFLDTIETHQQPFVFTYGIYQRKLNQVR